MQGIRNIFSQLVMFLRSNRPLLLALFIFSVLLRFIYLNYINWSTGELCTGHAGIQYGSDAQRYLLGAAELRAGNIVGSYKAAYIGYMAVIALGQTMGAGLIFTLLFQMMAAFLAALAIYDLIIKTLNHQMIAVIAAGYYLVHPFIVNWILFIHTESLYASMLIISIWALQRVSLKKTKSSYLLLFVIIGFSASLRPNGWVLVPVTLIFLIASSHLRQSFKVMLGLAVPVGFIALMNFSPWFTSNVEFEHLGDVLKKGEIICDPNSHHLAMPAGVFLGANDLLESTLYILKHPFSFTKLAALRVASELLPIYRPWLSLKFKIRFLLWMLPLYFFSIVAFFFSVKGSVLKFVMAFIISHLFIIALTFSEREFRFLVPMLPLFVLLGAFGLNTFLKKIGLVKSKSGGQ